MSSIIPVGTIMAWGGDTTSSVPDYLTGQGWVPCDGSGYNSTQYAELFKIIGHQFGGDDVTFHAPDLRGNFQRGTDHSTGRDPDAATRYSVKTGGATGDEVGSNQNYATGIPKAGLIALESADHTHSVPHVPTGGTDVAKGPLHNPEMNWNNDSESTSTDDAHTHTVNGGGDKETRPENVYVNWLVRADDPSGLAPTAPIGTIMPFAGDATSAVTSNMLYTAGWLPCFGQSNNTKDFPDLYKVIQNLYGGDTNKFNLPDLRGYFVRGVASGEKAGVTTDYSTSLPNTPFGVSVDPDHTHTVDHVPNDSQDTAKCAGNNMADWNDANGNTSSAGKHTHTVSGGDKETRSVNLYIDFIIRYI